MRRFLISLTAAFAVMFTVNAETYTHTFKQGELSTSAGTVTLTGVAWSASKADIIGWSAQKGIMFGNKSEVCESYSLSTEAFKDYTIKSITVSSSIAPSGDAKMTIKVGESDQETFELTTTNTAYKFSCNTKGKIEISWSATERAYYVKEIIVSYELPAEMVDIEEPVFKTPIGIYADNIYRVTVETADQSLKLFYTVDGTDPSYEDYVADKEGCTTGTSKTYAMYFQDEKKITKTTTIKVLAVKEDGEAVYKSEIVEATYIVSSTKPFLPASEVADGKRYAFFANDSIADALHITEENGYLEGREVAKKEKYIETVEYDAFIFTAVDGGYTIQDAAERFMYANSDNTFGFAKEEPATGAVWSITFDNGKATIKSGDKTIYYSKTDDRFGCYTSKNDDLELPGMYMLSEYPQAVITPAPGQSSEVENLKEITITCDGGIDFEEGTVLEAFVDVKDYQRTVFTCKKIDDNTLQFTSSEPVTTIDNVELYIELKGAIYLNPSVINMVMPKGIGSYKEAIAQYKLLGNAPAAEIKDIKPANNAEVEYLNNIIFTFDRIVNGIDSTKTARLYLEGSSELIPLTFMSSVEGENMGHEQAALVTETPVTKNGTYILEVPDGYLLDRNDRAVKGTTLKYVVKNDIPDSVEDIVAEGEKNWTVYNIMGIKVLETGNAELLNTLPRGLYIINGKKWIVE